MTQKKCRKCGEVKPVECFHKQSKAKDGLARRCKSCQKRYAKEWYLKDRENILEGQRMYQKENKDARYKQAKEWREKHKELCKEKRLLAISELSPNYVAQLLLMKTEDLTPEILHIKREQIEIMRLSRQIKTVLKEAK